MKIVFDDDREDIVFKAKLNIANKAKNNKNEKKVNKQFKKRKTIKEN